MRGEKNDEPRPSKKTPETCKLLKENIQALLFEATTEGEMDMVRDVVASDTGARARWSRS